MGIPIIFVIFVFISLFIFFNMKKGLKDSSTFQTYLEDESEANFARKRDIDKSLYVTPDLDTLPFKNDLDSDIYSRLILKQESVLEKSSKKMIFIEPPPSNKDLKLLYGMANLENISAYEDNYRKYILSLLSWADTLIEFGFDDDAALVLEHSISFGSDFRRSFTLLGEIYKKHNNLNALNKLYTKASDMSGASRDYICDYLKLLHNER